MGRNKTVHVLGAVIGLALFLATALLPALMYGGYAGLLLAGGIFGAPLDLNLLARGLIVFGSLLAVFACAAVFAVCGAATAAALAGTYGWLRAHLRRPRAA
jgi:hypothetical protein